MTTPRTSKTLQESLLPPEFAGRVELVQGGAIDPEQVENGSLYILTADNQLVPVSAPPAEFDAAVSSRLSLYDRNEWPTYHKAHLLTSNMKTIPVYRLKEGA